ncbi:MAG: glycosyltransferase family 8 protein, partial [Acutalibacteraceae bacterium]|nr:glycosyltransferase family 8 protein [Acutalibacteraceae bacterium]
MIYQKEIPVFFTIDNSYAPFLAAALSSAIKNCSPQRQYKAIILHQELTKENMEKLSLLATGNFSIEFVEMKDGFESITDRMSNRLRCDYFTLTIYFRLFIATMFPQYDKAIYIDSDVVVLGDLAELFDTDIGDNFIGACADKSVVDVPELARYMEEAVGVSRYEYINSGVLLMNLKALRENEFDKHFLNLLNTYHFDCIAPDQDYINAICNGKIHYLDEVWDAMPNEAKPPIKDTKIIHYNLFSKPWCYDNIQYEEFFWKYAEDSGYLDEIKEYKAAYSHEQKKADGECLDLLISRGE